MMKELTITRSRFEVSSNQHNEKGYTAIFQAKGIFSRQRNDKERILFFSKSKDRVWVKDLYSNVDAHITPTEFNEVVKASPFIQYRFDRTPVKITDNLMEQAIEREII